MEPIDLPQTASHPVSDDGLSQFLAHGHTHPVDPQLVFSGVEHQQGVALTAGGIKPAEDVIELQGFGIFRNNPSFVSFPDFREKVPKKTGSGANEMPFAPLLAPVKRVRHYGIADETLTP